MLECLNLPPSSPPPTSILWNQHHVSMRSSQVIPAAADVDSMRRPDAWTSVGDDPTNTRVRAEYSP